LLLSQESVFIPGKTIEQLRTELVSKIGENVSIKRFVRWEVGVIKPISKADTTQACTA